MEATYDGEPMRAGRYAVPVLEEQSEKIELWFRMPNDIGIRQAREEFDRIYLTRMLRLHGGIVSKTAKAIGMDRSALYRKLKGMGIDGRKV